MGLRENMDIEDFGSDWELPQFRHEGKSEVNTDRSKRRKLNPADSLQEEVNWLDWLEESYSSPQQNNQSLLKDLKNELPPDAKQEELNDAEKKNLSSLMKYLLDPEMEECQEADGLIGSGETIRENGSIERNASELELQIYDIMEYFLAPEAIENQEIDVISSSKSSDLQEFEEISDGDSEGIEIIDLVGSKRKTSHDRENIVQNYNSNVAVITGDDDHQWEEMQISNNGSHPGSPSSSGEISEYFQCYGPQSEEDYNAARVVHLLTACAEAVTNGNEDLSAVILARIEQLVSKKENTFQRVAACFYQILESLINRKLPDRNINAVRCPTTVSGAFQLLHEICPFDKFAHLTANQAILEAVADESVIHIVDFDIMEGLQWPPFIEALATRSNKVFSLRITAVQQPQTPNSVSSSAELTGRRLSEFAETCNIAFSFETVTLDEESGSLHLNEVNPREALVANCMLRLPHMASRNPKSILAFISAISKNLNIKLLTISDEALKCRSLDSTEKFFEILHYSCALFDSVEASLASYTLAKTAVEITFLVPRIWSTVSDVCQHQKDEEEEGSIPSGRWSSLLLLQHSGFQPLSISACNQTQARLLLAFFNEGYGIMCEGQEVAICWGDRPLVVVSAWQRPSTEIVHIDSPYN